MRPHQRLTDQGLEREGKSLHISWPLWDGDHRLTAPSSRGSATRPDSMPVSTPRTKDRPSCLPMQSRARHHLLRTAWATQPRCHLTTAQVTAGSDASESSSKCPFIPPLSLASSLKAVAFSTDHASLGNPPLTALPGLRLPHQHRFDASCQVQGPIHMPMPEDWPQGSQPPGQLVLGPTAGGGAQERHEQATSREKEKTR